MKKNLEQRERSKNSETSYQEFGLIQISESKWTKELEGQMESFEIVDWTNIPVLEEVVDLQQRVWGMPERDAVPSNLLAIAGDTGGNVLIARDSEGQIEGFILTMGVSDGTLFLHMIGVDPESRYKKNLGWNLSLLQLLIAKEKGITKIVWTYDPLRGSNARLNLEKLGATVQKYTINKYGRQNNELYGEDPTDRFTAEWDIDDPRVTERLRKIESGEYRPKTLQEVAGLLILEEAMVDSSIAPAEFLVEIPYDIDELPADQTASWRVRLRGILTSILDTESAILGKTTNDFAVTGFATGQDDTENTVRSFYIISRRGLENE